KTIRGHRPSGPAGNGSLLWRWASTRPRAGWTGTAATGNAWTRVAVRAPHFRTAHPARPAFSLCNRRARAGVAPTHFASRGSPRALGVAEHGRGRILTSV